MVKCLVAICVTTSCEMETCQIGHMATHLMPFHLCNMQISTVNVTTELARAKSNKQFTIVTYSRCKIVIFIFGKILALSNLRNFGLIIQNQWRKIIKLISQLPNIFYNCNLFCGIDHEIPFNDLDINR